MKINKLSLKETVTSLEHQKVELETALRSIRTAIESLQSVCDHKNDDGTEAISLTGHDSHRDRYKCSICGYVEWS